MKTSPGDLSVLIVGGGAVLAPTHLEGASEVLRPQWASIVNAIGAAMAKVSAVVDTIKPTNSKTTKQLLDEIRQEAIEKTVQAGSISFDCDDCGDGSPSDTGKFCWNWHCLR